MYVDEDSYGRTAIMNISDEDLEILRCAFLSFKTGIITTETISTHRYYEIIHQVIRIDLLLESIEQIQKKKQQQKQHS